MTNIINQAVKFKAQYGIAVAFVLLAVVGGWSINRSAQRSANELRSSQVAACKRGNSLRAESNRRIKSHVADRNTLAKFLTTAEIARRASNKPFDKEAADQYEKLRISLLKNVTFHSSPLVNCEKAVPNK